MEDTDIEVVAGMEAEEEGIEAGEGGEGGEEGDITSFCLFHD